MKFSPIEVEGTLKQGGEEEDDLKSAQRKMDRVREENERLKSTISQMMKDYNSLKMHLNEIVQLADDQPQKSTDSPPITASDDESELVSLRLGRFSGDATSREQKKISSYESKQQNKMKQQIGGLELGLDSCKFSLAKVSNNPSPENSLEGSKEEENNALCKSTKTARSGDDDQILEHSPLKKPRVSVRAVCDTQTMNDGCQWRKYGQKIAKGNPCPRAYYRCTISSSCPVRKQVQRCAENMSILTTTYEGTHNHPLPASAATMASATSAAAAMLKCGSSASPPPPPAPPPGVSATSNTTSNLLRFNFPSSNNLSTPFLPITTISTSQSHPTIILDLTAPNQTTSSAYNKSSSGIFSGLHSSSSTCLNFSNSIPHSLENFNTFQSAWNRKIHNANYTPNPAFESALAATITSFVGNGGVDNLDHRERNSGQNIKWSKNINFSQQRNLASFPAFSVSTSMAPTLFLPDDCEQIKL